MIIIVIITLSFPCSRYRRRRRRRREPCKPTSTTILIIITTVTCVSRAKYRRRRDVRCVLRTRVIGRPGRARDWTVLLRDVCALYTLAAARTRRVPVDYYTDCSSCSAAEEKKKIVRGNPSSSRQINLTRTRHRRGSCVRILYARFE